MTMGLCVTPLCALILFALLLLASLASNSDPSAIYLMRMADGSGFMTASSLSSPRVEK